MTSLERALKCAFYFVPDILYLWLQSTLMVSLTCRSTQAMLTRGDPSVLIVQLLQLQLLKTWLMLSLELAFGGPLTDVMSVGHSRVIWVQWPRLADIQMLLQSCPHASRQERGNVRIGLLNLPPFLCPIPALLAVRICKPENNKSRSQRYIYPFHKQLLHTTSMTSTHTTPPLSSRR